MLFREINFTDGVDADAVDWIEQDIRRAIERWQRSLDDPLGRSFSDEAFLLASMKDYICKLRAIARRDRSTLKSKCAYAQRNLFNSTTGKICSVLRAIDPKTSSIGFAGLIRMAEALDVWTPLPEQVRARWVSKPDGGYRLIVSFGPRRKAQAIMLRDMLTVSGVDNDFDFSRRGAGGEKQLAKQIADHIENGFEWWWAPDIRDCFPSIKPRHFDWLPIDRRLLCYVVYLPTCAKFSVSKVDHPGEILKWIALRYPDLTGGASTDVSLLTAQIARRGLPMGSALSPLLARGVIQRLVNDAVPDPDIVRLTYSDNLYFGARQKATLATARQTATKLWSSMTAGPIELNNERIVNAQMRELEVLGYAARPGQGFDGGVHFKPGRKRIDRFKQRLCQKLSKAGPDTDEYETAEYYWNRWYPALVAWTKVPGFSADLSWTITMTYVDDFIHGRPMGVPSVVKPAKTVQELISSI